MPGDRLSPLQWRILHALAGLEPPFTLTGGGALAGIHLHHRKTRDLDLFWRRRPQLGDLVDKVRQRLIDAELAVSSLQTSTAFHQLLVEDDQDRCVVDLVAEPFASLERPVEISLGAATLHVDSLHEILVNKICALLNRSELRDLEDVKALLEIGGDLEQALVDAPNKDGGFSPLTLAWVLRSFPVERLAQAVGAQRRAGRRDQEVLRRLRRAPSRTGSARVARCVSEESSSPLS